MRSAIVRTLVGKTLAAADETHVGAVTVGGGVAANRFLRSELARGAEARALMCFLPARFACTDNGAMIAWAGLQRLLAGERASSSLASFVHAIIRRSPRPSRTPRPFAAHARAALYMRATSGQFTTFHQALM